MALNFHELYVLLEFWGRVGVGREERGEVTLVLSKAGMHTHVFCFSVTERTGKKQNKKLKKNQQKKPFLTYSRDPASSAPA